MDPLANLHDIHLPNDIHSWPIALGWWALLIALLAIIFVLVRKIKKRRSLNRIKRQAIAKLCQQQDFNTEQTMTILKWVCMHYFKRQDVAALFGEKLLQYLANKLQPQQKIEFIALAENALLQQYRHSANSLYAQEFQQAALLWLHHAPLLENAELQIKKAKS